MIVLATFRIPLANVRAFQEYEDGVLPLLADHGGRLRDRFANADRTVEVHVLEFADRAGYDGYLRDPRRVPRKSLLDASGVRAEVVEDLA